MEPTNPVNPYAPPRAELEAGPATARNASLGNAEDGRYDFTIGDVMGEAWDLTEGMKASFWGAAFVIGIIYLVIDTLAAVVFVMFLGEKPGALERSLFNAVMGALLTPLTMGIKMMCVRRALGAPISFSTAFNYFSRSGPAIVGALLGMLLTSLGMLMLLIPGVYLLLGYCLSTQLICDQELPAWEALEMSRRAIHHKWWRAFWLFIVVWVLTGLSGLLVIPLIWTLPWAYMTTGVLYRRIFFSAPAAQTAPPAPVTPAGLPPA